MIHFEEASDEQNVLLEEPCDGIEKTFKRAIDICVKYSFPYFSSGNNYSIETEWESLVQETQEKLGKDGELPLCMAIVDVNIYMFKEIKIALTLGLLISETASEVWRNHLITFETTPKWYRNHGSTLNERMERLMFSSWDSYTDFVGALYLILSHAVKYKISKNNIPKFLFVFTCRNWDSVIRCQTTSFYYSEGGRSVSAFQQCMANARRAFRKAGYKPPHLVIWNLSHLANGRACETISPGMSQMNGYSHNMFNNLIEERKLVVKTPCDQMIDVLENSRYDLVRNLVRSHLGYSSSSLAR